MRFPRLSVPEHTPARAHRMQATPTCRWLASARCCRKESAHASREKHLREMRAVARCTVPLEAQHARCNWGFPTYHSCDIEKTAAPSKRRNELFPMRICSARPHRATDMPHIIVAVKAQTLPRKILDPQQSPPSSLLDTRAKPSNRFTCIALRDLSPIACSSTGSVNGLLGSGLLGNGCALRVLI